MRRFALFFGWLVVVGLATMLTWQIVSAADDRVSERPIAPLNVAAPALTNPETTTTTTTTPTSTSTLPTTTSTSSTGTTTASSTTTSSANTSSTTTPTSPPTTAAAVWQTRSVNTAGGTVNLRYRPGEVAYQSATPAPGFQVDVEKPGPPEVKVEFESESAKVAIEASWDGGDIRIDLSTEDEHEGEDEEDH